MRSEKAIVALVAAVNLVNVLEFVIVMPLGPDVAASLGVPLASLGLLGSAYTFAAAFAGLAGSFFLDRFDRRRALGVALLGMVFGTVLAASSESLTGLLFGRAVAGLFGGPATSLSFSIVADTIPPERRGRAMGVVLGAFSVASIIGVPAGLELARFFGRRAPLWAIAGLGLVVSAGAVALLPPMRGHLAKGLPKSSFASLFARPLSWLSWSTTATVMFSGFLVIPNLSAWVQHNLGLPRAQLSTLYLVGGVGSLVATQTAGFVVDRLGSARTGLVAVLGIAGLYLGFFFRTGVVPVAVLFVAFMVVMGYRNVAYQTLVSKVPRPEERARFLSIQSAVQHAASATGAFLSTKILVEQADGTLGNMPQLAGLSLAVAACIPALLFVVERRVRAA